MGRGSVTVGVAKGDAEEKKKLLLSTVGSGGGLSGSVDLAEVTVRLGVLPDQWENLEIAIEAFDTILEEAKEKMKTAKSLEEGSLTNIKTFKAKISALTEKVDDLEGKAVARYERDHSAPRALLLSVCCELCAVCCELWALFGRGVVPLVGLSVGRGACSTSSYSSLLCSVFSF